MIKLSKSTIEEIEKILNDNPFTPREEVIPGYVDSNNDFMQYNFHFWEIVELLEEVCNLEHSQDC